MTVGAKKVVSSFGWAALQNYLNRALGFVTTLILAKLLTPEHFGTVAVAGMVIEVLYLCKDMGVSQAIIHRSERVEDASNTGLILVASVNTGLFLTAAALAPFIARFYDDPTLTPVVILLASDLIWIGISSVPEARIRKDIQFHKLILPSVVPVAIASVVSIVMAFNGFGVWSLVVRTLLVDFLAMVMLWRYTPFSPSLSFDWRVAKELFAYGKYIVGTTVFLVTLYNIDKFFVSKFAGLAALGYYTLALRISRLPITEFSHVVCRVMFPVFSKIGQDPERLRSYIVKTFRYSAMVSVPMSVGIATFGPALVSAVYGEKWAPMAVPLQLLAVYALFRAQSSLVHEAYKGIGKPKLMQRFVIVRLIVIGALGVPVTVRFGVNGMCVLMLVTYIVVLSAEMAVLGRVVRLGLWQMVRSFGFPVIASTVIIPAVYGGLYAGGQTTRLSMLIAGILVVVALYAGSIALFGRVMVNEVKNTLWSKA